MTDARDLTVIQRWFDRHRRGGLVLPDGWFGRPFDTAFRLASIEERDDNVSMTLDQGVTVEVGGVKMVSSSDSELVIESCGRIRVEWPTRDDPPRESMEYSCGRVTFVRFPTL